MDDWAQVHPTQEVFAQIGSGTYQPKHMQWTRMMSPRKFHEAVKQASILVAHAGMGSFFVAMEMRKPVVMLPRRAVIGEHTTDHQLHTVEWLGKKPGVYVAMSEGQLAHTIDRALHSGNTITADFPKFAPEHVLNKIRQFIIG